MLVHSLTPFGLDSPCWNREIAVILPLGGADPQPHIPFAK